MQDLSQAMVKLSCVTDDTCCRVHNTLQSVSNRLRGPGKYSIALVNAGGRMREQVWPLTQSQVIVGHA